MLKASKWIPDFIKVSPLKHRIFTGPTGPQGPSGGDIVLIISSAWEAEERHSRVMARRDAIIQEAKDAPIIEEHLRIMETLYEKQIPSILELYASIPNEQL